MLGYLKRNDSLGQMYFVKSIEKIKKSKNSANQNNIMTY